MPGSAEFYLGDLPIADKLYAWKIARPENCGDELYCREIGDSDCTHSLGEEDPIAFIFRAYLEPETQIGPATNEIIVDRVIKFTRKP